MNQLFLISDEAWKAADRRETAAICADLRSLGLCNLPYPVIDIGVSLDAAVRFVDKDGKLSTCTFPDGDRIVDGRHIPPLGPNYLIIYRNICLDKDPHTFSVDVIIDGRPIADERTKALLKLDPEMAIGMTSLLIALLATRNVRREVQHNRLASLGIGKRNRKNALRRYRYITTLHPPSAEDLHAEAGTHIPSGRKRIPHLRRGHIRNQHFGPNRQFIKRIWIAPMFINASDEIIAQREAYNFSIRGASPLNLEQQSGASPLQQSQGAIAPRKESIQPCKSTQKLSSEDHSPSSSSSSSQSSSPQS